jgi:peptidoglycan/LPS O-acetylase OafA/YrhL
MSVTAESLTLSPTSATTRPASSLRRTTVVSGLVAAAVTTAAAAAVHAAGVSFEIEGEMIPLLGFAQMTFLGAVLGGLLLAVLNRRSGEPRRRFVQATAVLTALSCIPSVAMPDAAGTQVALVALHVLAAALVIPALARHAQA